MTQFTKKQGQYLAYIHLYRKLNRQGPAESDISRYFRVSPPTVHQMIVRLEELGLITREPGVPRSARIAIPIGEIPDLDD
jgi:repressor LexA